MTAKADKLSAEIEAFFAARELNNAPAWRPEPGETLIGEVVGLRMGTATGTWVKTIEQSRYPVVVFKTENGSSVSLHAFHTLLRDQLKAVGCKIGSRIAVSYDGERVTNDSKDSPEAEQTTYHLYFVADLDKIGTADGAGPVEEGFSFD